MDQEKRKDPNFGPSKEPKPEYNAAKMIASLGAEIIGVADIRDNCT
jgi:hypothetical protein